MKTEVKQDYRGEFAELRNEIGLLAVYWREDWRGANWSSLSLNDTLNWQKSIIWKV